MHAAIDRITHWMDEQGMERPPVLLPGVDDAAGPLAELHLVVGGQDGGAPLFEQYELMDPEACGSEKAAMDQLKIDEGWDDEWWSPSWHPFASDGCGQLLVVGAGTGAVHEFIHDDENTLDLSPTLLDYVSDFADRLETGDLVLDPELGVVDAGLRSRLDAQKKAREEREAEIIAEGQKAAVQWAWKGMLLLAVIYAIYRLVS